MKEQLKYKHIKTRFCPSPTGFIHLGNARTALFNALLARGADEGSFLLRIEDTDKERSDERYTENLQWDLTWLGLEWNEGPDKDKGLGPYHQSKRQFIYDDYYGRLESMGSAYPCFCTEEELALNRKIQRASGKPPRYPGTCRDLTDEQIKEKLTQGRKPTLRFRVPEGKTVEFDDLVRGKQRFASDDIGDFIIRRTDGTSPFMFCNAIDDSLMEVTHALRGEDHLTNTPRQIMMLGELGLPIPTYGHIALIVGPDGSPLSKRHGSRSVNELREQGFLPGAIVNYLARLGHYYGHDNYLTLQELADQFHTESLNKSPAKFNPNQLQYWQKEAITHLDEQGWWYWLGDSVKEKIPEQKQADFIEVVKANVVFPEQAQHWAEVVFSSALDLDEEKSAIVKSAGKPYFDTALQAFEQHDLDLSKIIDVLKTKLNVKGKALYQPLRVALTGELHGPELAKILSLMEHQEIQRRLEAWR